MISLGVERLARSAIVPELSGHGRPGTATPRESRGVSNGNEHRTLHVATCAVLIVSSRWRALDGSMHTASQRDKTRLARKR